MKKTKKNIVKVILKVLLLIITIPVFNYLLEYSFFLMTNKNNVLFVLGILLCGISLVSLVYFLDSIIRSILPPQKK